MPAFHERAEGVWVHHEAYTLVCTRRDIRAYGEGVRCRLHTQGPDAKKGSEVNPFGHYLGKTCRGGGGVELARGPFASANVLACSAYAVTYIILCASSLLLVTHVKKIYILLTERPMIGTYVYT